MANLMRGQSSESLGPVTWDPWAGIREAVFGHSSPLAETSFVPPVVVKETDDAFHLSFDVPGLDPANLSVEVSGNRLTVAGHRQAVREEAGDTWFSCERRYGAFSRTFTLPEGADLEHASAELANGVLGIAVPKRAGERRRKIGLRGVVDKVRHALHRHPPAKA